MKYESIIKGKFIERPNRFVAVVEVEEELHKVIWEKVKEINKTLPQYKYIKNLMITSEPLIKTTSLKVKRKEELQKVLNK